MPCWTSQPWPHSFTQTASGKTGAVQSARGVGLARFLLIDAMVRAVKSEIAPVAFIVDAKDEAAVRFYERESFLRLPEGRTRLVRRMSDIEAVLRS